MRIVVTGALGHIGSRLIRELPYAFPDAEIVMVDNLSTRRYASLFDLPGIGRYRFLELDVLSADLVPVFDGADAVLHLAAITDATESFLIREQVEEVNFIGTEKVARACVQAGCALLFVSTTSVYGSQAELVDEACADSDLQPQSPYAQSKLRAERLLHAMGRSRGLRHVICRFGTIFGISPGMRFHTAVNKFCWQAATGAPLTVWQDSLHQQRPYLDLRDAIGAITFLLQRGLFDGRVFNVLTLNAAVSRILDAISAYMPDLRVEYVRHRIMNQLSYRVSNRRFAKLGFEFRGDLDREIGETIRMLRPAVGVRAASAAD